MEIPAVSVIIPMYNAEKYIGECLNSLLAQTLKNFEVIVADDGSTDYSSLIVKSYSSKFCGRLRLISLEFNSKTGGYAARNRGFAFSRGEYVFFMDADDLLIRTALEELYTLAKKFNAEVVHCEKYYSLDDSGENFRVEQIKKASLIDEPTMQTENLSERVKEFCTEITWHSAWLRLVNREFLLKNEITFPNVRTAGDVIWCFEIICSAKRILRVPNSIYAYRKSLNSNLRKQKSLRESISFCMNPIIKGLGFLDKFLNRFEFFKQNPQYRYAINDFLIQQQLTALLRRSIDVPAYEIDGIFRMEFAEDMSNQSALISYLCSTINAQRVQFIRAQYQFNQFEQQVRQHIAQLENEIKHLKAKE